MIKKIFEKIKIFLRIRVRFDLPKKNKLLLFDEIHSSSAKKIFKRKFNILEVRYKKIYFWIYLKQIIIFDFKFETYCKNYIKFTSPKVIITFNEARYQMYELKDFFKDINFIAVANGLRFEHWFTENKKRWPKNLKCDYIFLINKYYGLKFKKLIKSNYLTQGHFRNNLVKINKTKFRKQFLYISQVHESFKSIDHEDRDHKVKLLNLINLYLIKNNKKIHILLRRSKKNPRQSVEINFYKEIFKSNCVFYQSDRWKEKYNILDQFENIIFVTSTMGYEAIARKKKVVCLGPPNRYRGEDHYFGWPNPNKKKYNFFSIKNVTYKEIERVLNNLNNCNQTNWNKKYYPILKDQSYYDKNNDTLRKFVLRLL